MGIFLRGKMIRYGGTFSAFEAEAICTDEALSWIMAHQLQNVIIESDWRCTVKALEGKDSNKLELDNILHSCEKM